MKNRFPLLFLSLLAGNAAAFQSQTPEPQPTPATESVFENQFYGFHAMAMQAVKAKTCTAVPVTGCQCAFCTQLRHAGTGN